jgi:hypothetical protein
LSPCCYSNDFGYSIKDVAGQPLCFSHKLYAKKQKPDQPDNNSIDDTVYKYMLYSKVGA